MGFGGGGEGHSIVNEGNLEARVEGAGLSGKRAALGMVRKLTKEALRHVK